MSANLNRSVTISIWLCISLFLMACDKAPDKVNDKSKPITTLSDANIKSFSQSLTKDYLTTQKGLLDSFYSHQKSGNAHGFTQYRNYTWTPEFIEKKDYYQAVLNKNRDYINKKSIKPLFLRFENLIYIGINLKNGLVKEDQALITSTLAEATEDKKIVMSLAKKF